MMAPVVLKAEECRRIDSECLRSSGWMAVSGSEVPSGLATYLLRYLDGLPEKTTKAHFSSGSLIEGPYNVPLLDQHYLPEIVFLRSAAYKPEQLTQLNWDSLSQGAARLTIGIKEAFELLCRYSNHYVQAGCLITDYCNLNCRMCMFHSNDRQYDFKARRLVDKGRQKIGRERMLSFIDQIPAGRRILFSASGEIFTCKAETLEYFAYARSKALDVGFISNGGLLDGKTADVIAETGISDAIFSVDGHTADVYREIRKGGDFQTTVKNIGNFIRIAGKGERPVRTAINTILFEQFEKQKSDIRNFWKTTGADRHNFLVERLDYLGKPRSLLAHVDEELKTCCFDPFQGPILLPNGEIAPCCSVAIGAYFEPMDWLCSIDRTSLDDSVHRYRSMLIDPDSPLRRYCRKCHYWSANYTCNGQNPFSETVDFLNQQAGKGIIRRLWEKWA